MSWEIEANLAEIMRLSRLIATLDEGPQRAALEAEREQRRERARRLADLTRSETNLRAELVSVERQLAEIDEAGIKPALHESYKLITDPSAYRRQINRQIAANTAETREALAQRRAELLEALATDQDSR